jgi:hypothetical protein
LNQCSVVERFESDIDRPNDKVMLAACTQACRKSASSLFGRPSANLARLQ